MLEDLDARRAEAWALVEPPELDDDLEGTWCCPCVGEPAMAPCDCGCHDEDDDLPF